MSSNTIEIVAGVNERTSRLALKRSMSAFGEVDACHMGDRAVMGDRFTEFPIVRFKIQSSADAALAALKAGQVFLDGNQLQGESRGGGGLAVRQRLKAPDRKPQSSQRAEEEEFSSRALLDQPSGSSRPALDSHNTFTGRDQRRDVRDTHSSRRLVDAPAHSGGGGGGRGGGGGGGGGRSRSRRRRSPSAKKRKEASRSRSRSHKPEKKTKAAPAATATTNGGQTFGGKLVKLADESVVGNLESAMSDNPLYIKR